MVLVDALNGKEGWPQHFPSQEEVMLLVMEAQNGRTPAQEKFPLNEDTVKLLPILSASNWGPLVLAVRSDLKNAVKELPKQAGRGILLSHRDNRYPHSFAHSTEIVLRTPAQIEWRSINPENYLRVLSFDRSDGNKANTSINDTALANSGGCLEAPYMETIDYSYGIVAIGFDFSTAFKTYFTCSGILVQK